MGAWTEILKQILILSGMTFFFYTIYQGVAGGGGSTSVFTGVGALVIALLAGYFIDKLAQD